MTFEVIRAIQDQEENGVVVASGFETDVDAIRYASQKDHEYFYLHREYRYPFTYHTTNKVRLCERSEPQSEPFVGQARSHHI